VDQDPGGFDSSVAGPVAVERGRQGRCALDEHSELPAQMLRFLCARLGGDVGQAFDEPLLVALHHARDVRHGAGGFDRTRQRLHRDSAAATPLEARAATRLRTPDGE
jgi:hypothetical protein